jgi:peroxiredoxin
VNERNPTKEALQAAWTRIDAADMPLAEKLSAYERASRDIVPDILAAYDRMVARTAGGETLLGVPDAGEVMPDFLCPSEKGDLVSLSSLLDAGPVVISFNRGHWCPYCKLELRELAGVAGKLRDCGANVVAIVPETAQHSASLAAANALPFPVLTDLDLAYALALGLVTPIGEEMQQLYAKAGIDLPRYQGNEFWMLPSPATFVLDSDGRILARFVDADFRRRMAMDAILRALGQAVPG